MTHAANEPTPDGIHAVLEYRPEPDRLSPNGAKKLLPPSTAARFDWDRRHPQKPKRVFDFGAAAHKLVLGAGDELLVMDPYMHGLRADGTPSAKPSSTAAWKEVEARARAEGLIPIHVDDYSKALEMADAVHLNPTAGPLLLDGDAEVWLYWTDLASGQKLRQRPDWLTRMTGDRLTIVEYKTATDASPEAFARTAFRFGYHIAAAFAVAGVKALGLDDRPRYIFIAQEKEPPYQVAVYELDDEAMMYGAQQMREAIATFQHCTKTGVWPGYATDITPIPLPLWAVSDEMEIQ